MYVRNNLGVQTYSLKQSTVIKYASKAQYFTLNYEMYIIIDWRGNGMCSRITAFCGSKLSLLKPKYFITGIAAWFVWNGWKLAWQENIKELRVYPSPYQPNSNREIGWALCHTFRFLGRKLSSLCIFYIVISYRLHGNIQLVFVSRYFFCNDEQWMKVRNLQSVQINRYFICVYHDMYIIRVYRPRRSLLRLKSKVIFLSNNKN